MPEYPWPQRRGDKVYLRMPDGSEKEVDVLTVFLQASAWVEAAGGLAVYQATKITPVKDDQ